MNLLLARRRAAVIVFLATAMSYAPCAMAHKTSYGYLKADFGQTAFGTLEG